MDKKPITTGHIPLDEMPEYLTQILTDFQHANFEARQQAVQKGAEVFKDALEAVTPRDTGEMARSWEIKDKYKDRRYVGNSRVASGDVRRKTKDGSKGEARSGVPLSNVLEYSDNPHNGFIRRCFDETESKIFETIKNTIQHGGN